MNRTNKKVRKPRSKNVKVRITDNSYSVSTDSKFTPQWVKNEARRRSKTKRKQNQFDPNSTSAERIEITKIKESNQTKRHQAASAASVAASAGANATSGVVLTKQAQSEAYHAALTAGINNPSGKGGPTTDETTDEDKDKYNPWRD